MDPVSKQDKPHTFGVNKRARAAYYKTHTSPPAVALKMTAPRAPLLEPDTMTDESVVPVSSISKSVAGAAALTVTEAMEVASPAKAPVTAAVEWKVLLLFSAVGPVVTTRLPGVCSVEVGIKRAAVQVCVCVSDEVR